MNVPTGTTGDFLANGLAFNVNAAYRVIPMLALGAEFGYFGNGATTEALQQQSFNEWDMTTLQFTGMAKFDLPVMEIHSAYARALPVLTMSRARLTARTSAAPTLVRALARASASTLLRKRLSTSKACFTTCSPTSKTLAGSRPVSVS